MIFFSPVKVEVKVCLTAVAPAESLFQIPLHESGRDSSGMRLLKAPLIRPPALLTIAPAPSTIEPQRLPAALKGAEIRFIAVWPAVLIPFQTPDSADRTPRAAKENTFAGNARVESIPSASVLRRALPDAVRVDSGPSLASENGSRLRNFPSAFFSIRNG